MEIKHNLFFSFLQARFSRETSKNLSMLIHWQQFSTFYTLIQHRDDIKMIRTSLVVSIEHFDIIPMADKSTEHGKLFLICLIPLDYTMPMPKSHRLKHKSVTCFHFCFFGSYNSTPVSVTGGEYSSLAVRPPNTYKSPLLTANDKPALGFSMGITSVHWFLWRSNCSTLDSVPSSSLQPPVSNKLLLKM